ncbi:MAG: PulJ/GspJ family protein [Patescibacteria group bacterium]
MRLETGQSLFEIMLALAISTLIIVAIVVLTSNAIRNTTFSKNKTLATRYSQEATEWLRGERDTDFTAFESRAATPLYCFPALSWASATVGACGSGQEITDTIFKREISFSGSVVNGKTLVEAGVKVYWTDSQGLHEVRSVTNFSDWREL